MKEVYKLFMAILAFLAFAIYTMEYEDKPETLALSENKFFWLKVVLIGICIAGICGLYVAMCKYVKK